MVRVRATPKMGGLGRGEFKKKHKREAVSTLTLGYTFSKQTLAPEKMVNGRLFFAFGPGTIQFDDFSTVLHLPVQLVQQVLSINSIFVFVPSTKRDEIYLASRVP